MEGGRFTSRWEPPTTLREPLTSQWEPPVPPREPPASRCEPPVSRSRRRGNRRERHTNRSEPPTSESPPSPPDSRRPPSRRRSQPSRSATQPFRREPSAPACVPLRTRLEPLPSRCRLSLTRSMWSVWNGQHGSIDGGKMVEVFVERQKVPSTIQSRRGDPNVVDRDWSAGSS